MQLLDILCQRIGYKSFVVRATDDQGEMFINCLALTYPATSCQGRPIYHTNVFLSIGDKLAVVCLDVVKDGEERQQLHKKLVDSGRCVVVISTSQMMAMAANCLEVLGDDGRRRLVISTRAWSLSLIHI